MNSFKIEILEPLTLNWLDIRKGISWKEISFRYNPLKFYHEKILDSFQYWNPNKSCMIK